LSFSPSPFDSTRRSRGRKQKASYLSNYSDGLNYAAYMINRGKYSPIFTELKENIVQESTRETAGLQVRKKKGKSARARAI
jgi:hypothetical protein